MVLFATYRDIGDITIAETNCERCGHHIGNLSMDEVLALSSGKYGPVLCFNCEDNSCGDCHLPLTKRDKELGIEDGEGGKLCWFCLELRKKVVNQLDQG